jgi:hypothetical protein
VVRHCHGRTPSRRALGMTYNTFLPLRGLGQKAHTHTCAPRISHSLAASQHTILPFAEIILVRKRSTRTFTEVVASGSFAKDQTKDSTVRIEILSETRWTSVDLDDVDLDHGPKTGNIADARFHRSFLTHYCRTNKDMGHVYDPIGHRHHRIKKHPRQCCTARSWIHYPHGLLAWGYITLQHCKICRHGFSVSFVWLRLPVTKRI